LRLRLSIFGIWVLFLIIKVRLIRGPYG